MKLTTAPQHEAILSNVGEIGEFRIRNSAKAFNILSSGLYANKIRAIIRELSCNAVDSHVAAGRATTPFDVHLPNALEPWFAIRDYGLGLSHDQVVNIYTTYFESTKTDSNAYIGALGLGSKSPFSYTDNFTVTATQNGIKGIYSAFINAEGVPSIAKMMEETTSDPNGVEVKFSVNERWDYSKFREEASHVYSYFKLQPVVSGSDNFSVKEIKYKTRDIIPGVHEVANDYNYRSVAIMGNIAYPIEVPNSETVLGNLSQMINCGLVMEFEIGELDFQASREGLSYIPQTIESIKNKLEIINQCLTKRLTEEADQVENLWDRAELLQNYASRKLWAPAVKQYITDTNFPLYQVLNGLYGSFKIFEVEVTDLALRHNIVLKSFNVVKNGLKVTCSNNSTSHVRSLSTTNDNSSVLYQYAWKITTSPTVTFVVNDTKTGSVERAKYHFKNTDNNHGKQIFVIEPSDKTKKIDTDEFFKELMNPPRVLKASSLLLKSRKSINKDVSILQLERRGGYNRNGDDMVWRDARSITTFNNTDTYYYLPIVGFVMKSKFNWSLSMNDLGRYLKTCGISELNKINIYGVRKADLEYIKTQSNWVNLEDHIIDVLTKNSSKIVNATLSKVFDNFAFCRYNQYSYTESSTLSLLKNKNGKFAKLLDKVKSYGKYNVGNFESSLYSLLDCYDKKTYDQIKLNKEKLENECRECYSYYPLLEMLEHSIDRSSFNIKKFIEYINLIDKQQKDI